MSINSAWHKKGDKMPLNYNLTLHYNMDSKMPFIFHLIAYAIPLLLLGLAPTLIPPVVQGIPFAFSCIFNLSVTRYDPAPNEDHLFTFFQFCTWMFSCSRLLLLGKLFLETCQYASLTYWSAFSTSVTWALVEWSILSILMITAFVICLALLSAVFRYTVTHDNSKMGFFGRCVEGLSGCVEGLGGCAVVCAAGAGDVLKGVHKGLMKCLSRCSDPSDDEAISVASPPPPYIVSP